MQLPLTRARQGASLARSVLLARVVATSRRLAGADRSKDLEFNNKSNGLGGCCAQVLHVETDFGRPVTLSGVFTNNFFTPFTVSVYVGPHVG